MKVVLDLDHLLAEGKITQAEYDKLVRYASLETSSLAFNLLVSFGVIAVISATIALVPSSITVMTLGALIGVFGFLLLQFSKKWELLAQISVLMGALLLSGGILWFASFTVNAWVIVTLLLATVGILLRNGLLIVLSVLSLSTTLGAGMAYDHAMYGFMIFQPAATIIVFTLLSLLIYQLSFRLPEREHGLAILAARTALFLINLAFWIGSLWGDQYQAINIPDWAFAIVWALALLLTAVWAVYANRRWVLNTCAIFAAIHFYTQWFERLELTPTSVLIAGILALLFALAVNYVNRKYFVKGV